MNTGMSSGKMLLRVSVFFYLTFWLLSACAWRNASPTLFIAPTPVNTPIPLVQATPPPSGPTATPVCNDSLHFLQDLTIPDNTVVAPGSSLDKQWQVENNGTCNWDSRYRLRFIGGKPLGAPPEQALYPARSGTQAVIRMIFTAPATPGIVYSEWQAYDPRGIPFGDSFFIKIDVENTANP
jgi:hypothetical protein